MATIEQTPATTPPPEPEGTGGPPGAIPHFGGEEPGHGQGSGITNGKLAMWLFLASDCLFFGAFIAAYLLYRGRHLGGLTPRDVFNIPFTSATSFILLMSSLTMVLALAAIQRADYRRLKIWLMATALFGATFVAGQVYEFTEFSRRGLKVDSNLFGSTFFILTGFHGAHVTVGIIWLLSLWGLASQGRLTQRDSERIEIAGLYWHFVDVVWIVIFTVVYLVPQPGR
jgi:cytochrome c oxidase subunit 3/cytochrome o ubiquinol oxidase subunit 3